jgi:hypothetical protein
MTIGIYLFLFIDNHILSDSDDDSIELILYTNQDNLTIFEKNKKCDAIKIKVDH